MISWLNELYELTRLEPLDKQSWPWDSQEIIRREYHNVLEYVRYHYHLTMTENGWYGEPKPNWRKTCVHCGSIYVVDGQQCACCADGL